MDTTVLQEGSKVEVLVRFGAIRSRIEVGTVTCVTSSRLHVQSGGKDRVFVRSTGAGYGDYKHCRIVSN